MVLILISISILSLTIFSIAAASASPKGSCVSFDSEQYLEAESPLLNLSGSFTVSFWVYLKEHSNSYAEFVSQGAQPYSFYIGVTPDLTIRAGDNWQDTGQKFKKGVWTHVALTRDSVGTADLYLDGRLVATRANYKADSLGSNLRLGAQWGEYAGERFQGCMDSFKIYDIKLSSSAIAKEFASGTSETSLPKYVFSFEEGAGNKYILSDKETSPAKFITNKSVALVSSANPELGAIRRFSIGAISMNKIGEGLAQNYYVDGNFLRPIPEEFGDGFSWFSSMWPMLDSEVEYFQVGLGSTWIVPYNEDQNAQVAQTVCGAGSNEGIKTIATDPKYGRYGLYLFQTIEGSLGWWGGQIFKTEFPKYALNVTQNCYETMVSTPGWPFFNGPEPLMKDQTGFVQVTNQILIPPDGITFEPIYGVTQLGISWQSLLFPNFGERSGVPSKDRAWNLFLKADNYSGIIGFVMPQFWSSGVLKNPNQRGLTLDTKRGYVGGMSAEWGSIPFAEVTAPDGSVYSKMPELNFYSDESGNTVINRDVFGYSSKYISNSFSDYVLGKSKFPINPMSEGKFSPGLLGAASNLYQNGDELVEANNLIRSRTTEANRGFGFNWTLQNARVALSTYFKKVGSQRVPVPESEVPQALQRVDFKPGPKADSFVYQAPSWWIENASPSREFTTMLADGTSISYRWFKFNEQPALQRLRLSDKEKDVIQDLAEEMQVNWQNDSLQANPSSGVLGKFDRNIKITPPKEFAIGYVPIVTKQFKSSEASGYRKELLASARSNWSLKQKQLMEAKAAAELKAKQEAETKVTLAKKTTITCTKGKLTKKVTAIKPKCPKGYKKK